MHILSQLLYEKYAGRKISSFSQRYIVFQIFNKSQNTKTKNKNIFSRYFIETHREVKAASSKGAMVPSVWEKSKNMRLHILTILIFYLSAIVALTLPFWAASLGYVSKIARYIYISNSSINPFLTLVFVNDFNIAIKAMLRCRLPATVRKKAATKKLQIFALEQI